MSTKANFRWDEVRANNPIFSATRTTIETAFYGNNVVKVNSLKEAYKLAKNSRGTIVTDMPVEKPEEIGLDDDAKILVSNSGAVFGRTAAARRIAGEEGVDVNDLCMKIRDAIYDTKDRKMYHTQAYMGLGNDFIIKAQLIIPEGEENLMYNWLLNFQYINGEYTKM